MSAENNVAAQAGDEPMRDLVAGIKALKCTPPDYRSYAMDAEQRGYHKDGFRGGFKAAISSAAALAAQVSPRATADVERDAARYCWLRDSGRGMANLMDVITESDAAPWYELKCDVALDYAIDAAIATTKPGA